MANKQNWHALLQLFRCYQRRGKLALSVYGWDLSLPELYILAALERGGKYSVRKLSEDLRLDRSSISRALHRLDKNNYLKLQERKSPRQALKAKILTAGEDALRQRDYNVESFIDSMCANISLAEQVELQSFLVRIADGDEAPPLALRPKQHPLFVDMWRLAISHGIHGRTFMGSGYSSAIWQILSELTYSDGEISPKYLKERLTVKASTLSQLIAKLEGQKLIKNLDSKQDGRKRDIKTTALGKKVLKHIEDTAIEKLKFSMSTFSEGEFERFLNLFQRYVGDDRVRSSLTLFEHTYIAPVLNETERQAARGFCLLHLVRLGWHLTAPEVLLGSDKLAYAMYSAERLRAVAEFTPEERFWKLETFVFDLEMQKQDLLKRFLKVATEELLHSEGVQQVMIPHSRSAYLDTSYRNRSIEGEDGFIFHAPEWKRGAAA